MADSVIQAEGLGKLYRIGSGHRGHYGYTALRDVVMDKLKAPFRFLRSPTSHEPRATSHENIWALKNVSFEIQSGEVVGVIGRNGAGKSTLLKILSRITEPTEGHVRIRGRVGSLLEVGTGFHPELTGRENVFLNGAILGMRKTEIDARFDEIMAFSEIEKFVDTPVKFYSTGMFMRLAFSVAAHFDPEILLVDEVLAVGDVAFQKKCFGKMDEVAGRGRTVLLVSHNLGAISNLTQRTIYLEDGSVRFMGPTEEAVRLYLATTYSDSICWQSDKPTSHPVQVLKTEILTPNGTGSGELDVFSDIPIAVEYEVRRPIEETRIAVLLYAWDGTFLMSTEDTDANPKLLDGRKPGRYSTVVTLPGGWLARGDYHVRVSCYELGSGRYQNFDDIEALRFTLVETGDPRTRGHRAGCCYLLPTLPWKTQPI